MPPDDRNEKCILSNDMDKTQALISRKPSISKQEPVTSPTRDSYDAWFTLVLVFLVNVLLGLNWIAFSVFYIYFTDCFEVPKSTTGWIGSIQVGVTNMFGILVSPLVSKWGCRATASLGSFIVTVAMLLSFLATQVWHLHLTYGVLAGVGLCMLYMSNAVVLQQKFQYNRALAGGIGMAGLSLGSTLGSPVTEYLIEHYGWRGALMMHAAIIAHCMVLTQLYKTPLQFKTKEEPTTVKSKEIQYKTTTTEKSRTFWSHLCEFSLLKHRAFSLFCAAYLLLMINSSAFWYHLQSRAVYNGVAMHKAAFLTSFLAFAIFLSRIVFSFIANCQCSNTILIFTVGCFIGALSSFLLPMLLHYEWMAFCAVLFGCHIGCAVTVITVSAVYLIGAEHIARGQAFLNLSYGTAALVSTPFAGWVVDASGDYNMPFFINGGMALCGSVLALGSYLHSRHKLHTDPV